MAKQLYIPNREAARELAELVGARHDLQSALSRLPRGTTRPSRTAEAALVWLDADIPPATIDDGIPEITPQAADVAVLRHVGADKFGLSAGRGTIEAWNFELYERWCLQPVWARKEFGSKRWVLAPDVITPLDAIASGTITGRSGTTPGSGSAIVQRIGTGYETWLDCESASRIVPVNNPYVDAIADGQRIQIVRQAPTFEFAVLGSGAASARPRFGRCSTNITAATGTLTLGSGSVVLWENTGTAASATATTVMAYNYAANAILSGTFVELQQYDPSGDWFIQSVDCGV